MWDYSEKVKDHFFNPRNAKAVDGANAIGDVGSIVCGDALRLTLRVNPETEIIEDAGFQTFGCGSAIASSSALTCMIKGKTLEEASKITNKDIADYLDGLPPEKMHCSVMGREALDAAIANFRGVDAKEEHIDSPLVCKCFGIDEAKIVRETVENNLNSVEDVINYTKAGGACGSCHEAIEKIIAKIHDGKFDGMYGVSEFSYAEYHRHFGDKMQMKEGACSLDHEHSKGGCDGASETSKDEEKGGIYPNTSHPAWLPVYTLIEEIRPNLQADGGDIELLHVYDDHIDVRLSGHCLGCMMEDMTVSFINNLIKERLALDLPINVVKDRPENSDGISFESAE